MSFPRTCLSAPVALSSSVSPAVHLISSVSDSMTIFCFQYLTLFPTVPIHISHGGRAFLQPCEYFKPIATFGMFCEFQSIQLLMPLDSLPAVPCAFPLWRKPQVNPCGGYSLFCMCLCGPHQFVCQFPNCGASITELAPM